MCIPCPYIVVYYVTLDTETRPYDRRFDVNCGGNFPRGEAKLPQSPSVTAPPEEEPNISPF